MSYAAVTFTASESGTYGNVNNCMGQLVDYLIVHAASGLVTVIADNNPSGGAVARIIDLQLGTSLHYIRLKVQNATGINYSAWNLAHSAMIGSATAMTIVNSPVKILLGPNAIFCTTGSAYVFGALKCVDDSWKLFQGTNSIYDNASNSVYNFSYAYYASNLLDSVSGNIPLIKAGVRMEAYISFFVNVWGYSSTALSNTTGYTDGTTKYYTLTDNLLIGE